MPSENKVKFALWVRPGTLGKVREIYKAANDGKSDIGSVSDLLSQPSLLSQTPC